MSKLTVEDTSLVAVADAIRTKGGTTDTLIFPDGFVDAIGNIQGGGGEKVYNIATNKYTIDVSSSSASSSTSYMAIASTSTRKDVLLGGSVPVKVETCTFLSSISIISGTKYYKSVSLNMGKVFSSLFGDNMIPDGTYIVYFMVGNGRLVCRSISITISNGMATSSSKTVDVYHTSSSFNEGYLYLTHIIKTA